MYDEFSPNGPISDHEPYLYDDGQGYLGKFKPKFACHQLSFAQCTLRSQNTELVICTLNRSFQWKKWAQYTNHFVFHCGQSLHQTSKKTKMSGSVRSKAKVYLLIDRFDSFVGSQLSDRNYHWYQQNTQIISSVFKLSLHVIERHSDLIFIHPQHLYSIQNGGAEKTGTETCCKIFHKSWSILPQETLHFCLHMVHFFWGSKAVYHTCIWSWKKCSKIRQKSNVSLDLILSPQLTSGVNFAACPRGFFIPP